MLRDIKVPEDPTYEAPMLQLLRAPQHADAAPEPAGGQGEGCQVLPLGSGCLPAAETIVSAWAAPAGTWQPLPGRATIEDYHNAYKTG